MSVKSFCRRMYDMLFYHPLTPNMTRHTTYAERADRHKHALAKELLQLMERKQTNLCLSIDVTKSAELLRIVEIAAPYLCMVKVRAFYVCFAIC